MTITCVSIVSVVKNHVSVAKTHFILEDDIQVHVCTTCDKHWCYMYPRCKINSNIDVCEVCQEKDSKN